MVLQELVLALAMALMNILQMLKTRNNRNQHTVLDLELLDRYKCLLVLVLD
jgi:hypothetical protein